MPLKPCLILSAVLLAGGAVPAAGAVSVAAAAFHHQPVSVSVAVGGRRETVPGLKRTTPTTCTCITSTCRSTACTSTSSKSVWCSITTATTITTTTRLMAESKRYGRGSEIWPPTNEGPVLLSDSFPLGVVPSFAADRLSQIGDGSDDNSAASSAAPATPSASESSTAATTAATSAATRQRGRKRRLIRGAVGRVLRRASTAEQRTASGDRSARGGDETFWDAPVDRLPAALALILGLCGLVRSTDAMAVAGLTAYLVVLGLTSSSPKELEPTEVGGKGAGAGVGVEGRVEGSDDLRNGGSGTTVSRAVLPSLPPQGHVPSLVSNPLGVALTNSAAYRTWLRLGATLGILLPFCAVGWYGLGPKRDMVAAAAVARPVFLVCCQAVSEATSRRLLAPLPLRILIPVAYSAVRLGPLWDWALTTTTLGPGGRMLAIANYVYWATNLFGFLLPVGVVRYMRAHYFCVEAAEVQLREGQETSAGLLP